MSLGVYRGKRVLVTGDTGFKGSWLAIWLRELGADVAGYALPAASSRDNYVVTGLSNVIRHVDGDVRDYAALHAVIERERPEIVFHLAAQAIVLDSYRDPRGTFDTNVMGVVNVLEAVRHVPSVRAVVIVTSDKCYENVDHERGYVEGDPLGGRDPYSGSKGAAEIAASSMRRSFFEADGTAAIATARAGNVIGAGDWGPHRIVPDCIRALSAGEPIVVRNPTAVRPWQHVLDALHGYLMLGSHLVTRGRAAAGAWNFGPVARTIVPVKQLVESIIGAWGEGKMRIETPSEPRPHEARYLHLDSGKAQRELGWAPRLDWAQTIALTVDGYRAERGVATTYDARCAQIQRFAEGT